MDVKWTAHAKQGGVRGADDIHGKFTISYHQLGDASAELIVTHGYSNQMHFWTDHLRSVRPAPSTGLKRFNIVMFGECTI